MSGSSMYKTKLCILFNKTGTCSRPNCTFAHGNAELRRLGDSSFTGTDFSIFLRFQFVNGGKDL